MRILFVASNFDTQTAYWIKQLNKTGWDIHLFDPIHGLLHPDLRDITVHTGWRKEKVPQRVTTQYYWPFLRGRHFIQENFPQIWKRIVPNSDMYLANLVKKIRPDIIHSLGMQPYGYTVYQAKERMGSDFDCPWIYSCKGNDIFYYIHNPEHKRLIELALNSCQYLIANGSRDIELALQHGFDGEIIGLFQGMGGYPILKMRKLQMSGPISNRRIIALKGLQHDRGRALIAIEALKMCKDLLDRYEIKVYQAHQVTREEVLKLSENHVLNIEIIPRKSPWDIYQLFGKTRIAIGVCTSDGIPNAMIEAMIMGAFPIQTNPGGITSEIIEDGVNGMLIPAEDPLKISKAIRRSLVDDHLVDSAAQINLDIAYERFDITHVQPRVIALYEKVHMMNLSKK